jgi:hypothetical protein
MKCNQGLAVAFVASVVLFVPRAAQSAPAPLSEQQLEKGSDLIVEVDVLSVTKRGTPAAPFWQAQLHVRKTLKGTSPSEPMPYAFQPPQTGELGGRNESVYAGEHLRLFLFRDKTGHYAAWAPNSVDLLDDFPTARRILPSKIGETIFADGTRRQ